MVQLKWLNSNDSVLTATLMNMDNTHLVILIERSPGDHLNLVANPNLAFQSAEPTRTSLVSVV